jgi:hypothetical protein
MLRRAALLLLLSAPLGARADVTFTPSAFGSSDRTSSASYGLAWTVTSSSAIATGDFYKFTVSSTSTTCPTDSASSLTPLQDSIAATSTTQSASSFGTRQDLLSKAGVTATTTSATVFVCVQLWTSAGATGTPKGTTSGSVTYSTTPPPTPESVVAKPGDSAIYLWWADGSDSSVAVDHYEVAVTVVALKPDPALDSISTHSQTFTGSQKQYFPGLVNGQTYTAKVRSVSASGDKSGWSDPSAEVTPKPVLDFWDQYHAAGGVEQGGCAGGAAGLLSLVALGGLLRGLRRRP